MKIAVPVAGGVLCPHFGHCEQFALYDVDENNGKIVATNFVTPPEHQPGILPPWLAQQGANVILAGGMGGRAQELFHENGIQVVMGVAENDPEKAVLSHLTGSLVTGDNTCDHGEHDCNH